MVKDVVIYTLKDLLLKYFHVVTDINLQEIDLDRSIHVMPSVDGPLQLSPPVNMVK